MSPLKTGHTPKAPTVFIDGEAGTTGLEIRNRLATLPAFKVKSIAPERRKDPVARKEMMESVDAVILCLPDDAAREAVALAASLGANAPRIIDASTAHRVAPDWVYGFPEMTKGQTAAIRAAKHVSNPGCYPTGAIALIRPLVETGLLTSDTPITINAVSGYSGGGKSMIEAYEAGTAPSFELYGLAMTHKHLPETQLYSLLKREPIFVPSVGNFRQGMLVSVPLHLDTLASKPSLKDIEATLAAHFAGSKLVSVIPAADASAKGGRLPAETLNHTDKLELRVFGSADGKRAVLVARLDNLGKGASGACVQNLSVMFSIDTHG
jgi:N-acetyl-gamma-glutamyl-phosphate reductase